MAYKIDPKALAARRKAEAWHKLLNNGFHFVLRHPTTGKIEEKARFEAELDLPHRLRPYLELIHVDAQI